ncbi:MAG: hypothetical protein QM682_06455 [Paracoccus sp. (in: a-proteobacteria)]|uniref:hypothetical protein n=1 Tax=Paracoccus sp. TaxID=267 RepID=UPI0039E5FBD1
MKIDRRAILAADPKSFNDPLDFFEAYATGLCAPLDTACNLIREQLNYHGGDIFGHIRGVSHVSLDLVEQLKKIRAHHNMGRTVSLSLLSAAMRRAGD